MLNQPVPTCVICNKEVPDYKPQFCCNAFDCGCQGKPLYPPICSTKCWDKLMNTLDTTLTDKFG